ncbi:MAG TPA: hypothetical protein VNM90_14680 [Haliangium sp.]|nr:hypothetical protein [Haliangium sp.]
MEAAALPAIRHWYVHRGEGVRPPRPQTWPELFARLFAGDLFVLAGPAASRALASRVRRCLADVTGVALPEDTNDEPPKGEDASAAWRCPALDAEVVARVREALYAQPDLHAQAAAVVAALGMREAARVDAPRLRVITAGAEREPAAAPVYVVHRDTWYGCDQAQVNWWIPIFDTPAEQVFVFYPDYFDQAVPNTSARFDYDTWMATIGWHGEAPLDAYPQPTVDVTGAPALRFDCRAGDILLFAAAQLHQTRPNPIAGTSRLSVDLRTVIDGVSGIRAPNVDNASRGADERVAREFVAVSALV